MLRNAWAIKMQRMRWAYWSEVVSTATTDGASVRFGCRIVNI